MRLRLASHLFQFLWVGIFLSVGCSNLRSHRVRAQLIPYQGWESSLEMQSDNRTATRFVLVPQVGGRFMYYGLNGENILWEASSTFGKTLTGFPEGFWPNGSQCDIGPELRGVPEHNRLWIGPYSWRQLSPESIDVESETEPSVGVRTSKSIAMDAVTGDLKVLYQIRNMLPTNASWCHWDRTQCRGGGFVLIPMNLAGRYPKGWGQARWQEGARTYYDGVHPDTKNVRVIDGILVAKAEGRPTKIGSDSTEGWIGYTQGKQLLIKRFPVEPGANYSDDGNTLEAYWDDRFAELEPLSPQATLRPGEVFDFPQRWSLFRLDREVTTWEEARRLVSRFVRR